MNINFIGKRFKTLIDIEIYLKQCGAKNPKVFQSESDRLEELDFILDGCLNDGSDETEYFSLYYLKDNADNYYITEGNFW